MAFITLKPGIYEFIGSLSDFVDIKASLHCANFYFSHFGTDLSWNKNILHS